MRTNETALMVAARDPSLYECLTGLLQARRLRIDRVASTGGYNALHLAAANLNLQAMSALLRAGANPAAVVRRRSRSPTIDGRFKTTRRGHNAVDRCRRVESHVLMEGRHGLHILCATCPTPYTNLSLLDSVVSKMCATRGVANAFDKDGSTPLHLAAEHGNDVVLQLLLRESSVDLTMRSGKSRMNALEIARSAGYQSCVDLLMSTTCADSPPAATRNDAKHRRSRVRFKDNVSKEISMDEENDGGGQYEYTSSEWSAHETEEGFVWYYNHKTGMSQWENPWETSTSPDISTQRHGRERSENATPPTNGDVSNLISSDSTSSTLSSIDSSAEDEDVDVSRHHAASPSSSTSATSPTSRDGTKREFRNFRPQHLNVGVIERTYDVKKTSPVVSPVSPLNALDAHALNKSEAYIEERKMARREFREMKRRARGRKRSPKANANRSGD